MFKKANWNVNIAYGQEIVLVLILANQNKVNSVHVDKKLFVSLEIHFLAEIDHLILNLIHCRGHPRIDDTKNFFI